MLIYGNHVEIFFTAILIVVFTNANIKIKESLTLGNLPIGPILNGFVLLAGQIFGTFIAGLFITMLHVK